MEIKNESVEVVETENHDTEQDLGAEETVVESEEAQPEEKPKETPEAKLARLERQANQLRKKLGLDKPEVKPEPKSDSNELDKGDKALLVAYGIKGADEFALAKKFMDRTGDDIDTLVNDEIFNARLKSLREVRDAKQALPNGSKKAPSQSKDSVDYHLERYNATGELPSDFKMRAAVLNAKVAKATSNPFN